ncbi:MAG: Rrf2 family transcriptional regulator [Pseudomonadota bacterium]
MRINKGVEWAVHAAALMVALPEGAGLSADALARYHDVPPAYMAKQLQAMSKAGIIRSMRGARGGYRLARPPAEISLLDIWLAIEGDAPAYRSTELRQSGPCGLHADDCSHPCPVAEAFHGAEAAFRNSLKAISLAETTQRVRAVFPAGQMARIADWIAAEKVDGVA